MENKITQINGVMYGKWNNRRESGSLMMANKKGVVVINNTFKKVLQDVVDADNTTPCIAKGVTVAESSTEVELLWQGQIHKNHMKIRGGK